jgi:hypothetical protein
MAAVREEAADLAEAIMTGVSRRPVQSFGEYFGENGGSDALGAAYEGIFLLPRDVRGFHPRVWRLFDFLENTARHCPAGCRKYLPIAALMVHPTTTTSGRASRSPRGSGPKQLEGRDQSDLSAAMLPGGR